MLLQPERQKSIAWSIQAQDINEHFFWSNTLPHQSTFIKTTLLNKIGGYNLDYHICADWAFWYEAIVEHKCTYSCIKILFPTWKIGVYPVTWKMSRRHG